MFITKQWPEQYENRYKYQVSESRFKRYSIPSTKHVLALETTLFVHRKLAYSLMMNVNMIYENFLALWSKKIRMVKNLKEQFFKIEPCILTGRLTPKRKYEMQCQKTKQAFGLRNRKIWWYHLQPMGKLQLEWN